jgi:hypothetical protein
MYDALPWYTRPLRWSIHRLASVCTNVHSPNPIARRRGEAQQAHRLCLLARAIRPLPSPMMLWPPRAVVETVRTIMSPSLFLLCSRFSQMYWVLSHPRDSPGSASAPHSAHAHRRRDVPTLQRSSSGLKRTSTASTTTPRYRAQLRATLPSHSSMFHRVHRTSP